MIEINPDLLLRVLNGDQDAQEEARDLLPKVGNLFGRWATHPTNGRVLCINDKVSYDGKMLVYSRDAQRVLGSRRLWLNIDSLEFDPDELVTVKDFEDAPEGTIVDSPTAGVHEKQESGLWNFGREQYSAAAMQIDHHPWRVVRWGNGEKA